MQCRDRCNDQVASDLRRIVDLDVETGPDAGADDHRFFPRELHNSRPERVEKRRHDRGNDDALEILNVDVAQGEDIFQVDAVLVRCFDKIGRDAELIFDLHAVHAADDDVAVANVDRK